MRKLTKAQREALRIMCELGGVRYTSWGGRPWGSMPPGIRSTASLKALKDRDLATARTSGFDVIYTPTPAGRAALAEEKGE